MSISVLQRGLRLWIHLQKRFVGVLTSLVREDSKINLEIITLQVCISCYSTGTFLFRKVCKRQIYQQNLLGDQSCQ